MSDTITMELTLDQAKALADITAQVLWPGPDSGGVYQFYYDLTDKLERLGEDEPTYELDLDEEQGTIRLVKV
jgi:hypothetical protein